jgi:ribonuclease HII
MDNRAMDYLFQDEAGEFGRVICGVDEVGRGPLAGPVVAAAVILDPKRPIEGIRDSKKLTPRKREALDVEIREKALAWSIGEASVQEIDELNILQATMLAMKRAIMGLQVEPDMVLVDGNRVPQIPYRCEAIVKGDDTVQEIGAASILAKVYRDNLMKIYDSVYPKYGFVNHAGYGTPVHLKALEKYGPCPIHRTSFEPVRKVLKRKVRKADRAARKANGL